MCDGHMAFHPSRQSKSDENEIVYINGTPIRLYVREHLNKEEEQVYTTAIRTGFRKYQLDFYERYNFEEVSNTRLLRYANLLAFFQRIRLPLDKIIGTRIGCKSYPLEDMPNFIHFRNVFDEHFSNQFPTQRNNLPFKKKKLENCNQLLLKLWLCGYGLTFEYGHQPITLELMQYLDECYNSSFDCLRTSLLLISSVLKAEINSPVNQPYVLNKKSSLEERQIKAWNRLEISCPSALTMEIRSYVFNVLHTRVNGSVIKRETDSDGRERTVTLSNIKPSTFDWKSRALLKVTTILYESGIYNLETLINEKSVDEFMKHLKEKKYAQEDAIKAELKSYLLAYSADNNLAINVERLFPTNLSRTSIKHGKILDIGSAISLLRELLNPQSPHFNENKLNDFRHRRICLLQITTAARIHEVTVLKKDCIKTDSFGVHWVHFHKTKKGKERYFKATTDVLQWINELQEVSPSLPISISSETYLGGDDLVTYRLFGCSRNVNPISTNHVHQFLIDLQKKMWGDEHPNGTPFSTHDLRRLSALYYRYKGYSMEDIRDLLGHASINSLLPYLSTHPPEYEKAFAEIQEEGVWSHLYEGKFVDEFPLEKDAEILKHMSFRSSEWTNLILEPQESKVSISLDKALRIMKNHQIEEEEYDEFSQIAEELFQEYSDMKLPNFHEISESETGIPMALHNCTAHTHLNCGHTELHCYPCEFYKPDDETYKEHKAQLLRFIIMALQDQSLARSTKKYWEKEMLTLKFEEINPLISNSFKKLFRHFGLNTKEVRKLEDYLRKVAKNYITTQKGYRVTPTLLEAMELIKET